MNATQEIKLIKVSDLKLWTENPRDPIDENATDVDVINRAVDSNPKDWNLDKLLLEMGSHYDFSEIPTVVYVNNKPVVYDGNRRVAILKYLQDQKLYSDLSGRLFLDQEPTQLKDLKEIPCNVCDPETALTNIERKHSSNGSWTVLQRDYFLHYHRGYPKSILLILEEQTKLITNNPKLNKRFVRDEVLTPKNLKDVGIFVDKEKEKILSNYDNKKTDEILSDIVSVINSGDISTRGENRGKLKDTLEKSSKKTDKEIEPFDEGKSVEFKPEIPADEEITKRRTPVSKKTDLLFGRTLSLKDGQVNDLYRAVDGIFTRFKSSPKDLGIVLPIVGMSLRLMLDVGARNYFAEHDPDKANKDQLYRDFLSIVKKDLKDQSRKNYLSLTNNWLSDSFNVDGMLAKYAHGNITSEKSDIINASCVVGDILEEYFGK